MPLAALALALQGRVARVGGELGFRGRQALFGVAALNDVDPAKNDDGGVDALGVEDLLRFGDLQQLRTPRISALESRSPSEWAS